VIGAFQIGSRYPCVIPDKPRGFSRAARSGTQGQRRRPRPWPWVLNLRVGAFAPTLVQDDGLFILYAINRVIPDEPSDAKHRWARSGTQAEEHGAASSLTLGPESARRAFAAPLVQVDGGIESQDRKTSHSVRRGTRRRAAQSFVSIRTRSNP
jgi:hypothetical protein